MRNQRVVACLILVVAFVVSIVVSQPRIEAAARNLTASQIKDSNSQVIQQAPAAQLWDGLASSKSISNLVLTSNVATITTSAAHGYATGQRVVITLLTGPTNYADVSGTYVIASTPSSTTFTVAKTHANITTGAATGSTVAYNLSPIPTGTTEQTLVFPGGSFALVIIPTANVTDCTFSYTSGGGIGGTFPLYANTANVICGVEGDTVYIQRTTTTPLAFQFAQGK